MHGIWHSKKQAWAGIDRILPTGGRFGFEEYHNINGNMAKLENYLKHARNELRTIEAHLPQTDKGVKGKDEKKIKLTLDGERNGLFEIQHELNGEHAVYDKSTPQMLAQQPKATQSKTASASHTRVYMDNALYGEGIQGDIKSQGHHARKWSRRGADADMAKYYASLATKVHTVKSKSAWHKRAGDEMDEYMHDLAVSLPTSCHSLLSHLQSRRSKLCFRLSCCLGLVCLPLRSSPLSSEHVAALFVLIWKKVSLMVCDDTGPEREKDFSTQQAAQAGGLLQLAPGGVA